jgi:cytochrome P450
MHFVFLLIKEIKGNIIQFLVAGYETTSSAISNCVHVLANKPEELQKLHDEIDANIGSEVNILEKKTLDSS